MWVWIRRQTIGKGFLAQIVQLGIAQTTFNISAGVDTWGRVPLHEYQVAFYAIAFGFPEVVETYVIQGGGREE